MAKLKSVYICQTCGGEQPKWAGQCNNCGAWNSLVEALHSVQGKVGGKKTSNLPGKVFKLSEVKDSVGERLSVGSEELSQVLGGGMVVGSVVLLSGEPGIGKSTLLSQLTLYFASKHGKVLYVCGEESPEQVKIRLNRLSVHKKTSGEAKENILLFPESDIDRVIEVMVKEKPLLTIVDSIQTMVTGDLSGMAGSVGQVRECGMRVLNTAKSNGLSTFLVGHVTKEGTLAGPKVLEHMVDVVTYLTGDRSGGVRLLRAAKNRFGVTDEVGVFQMTDSGLTDVTDPSRLFMSESGTSVPGSAVTVVMEGTRPLLCEVQALVVSSNLPTPRRVAQGVKLSRVQLLCAVVEKFCGINLSNYDVFINVAGGMNITEPAADAAVCAAIVSSFKEIALPKQTVVIGEVGLLGEIRKVGFSEKRVKAAAKVGYLNVVGLNEGRVEGVMRILVGKHQIRNPK